MTNAQTEARAIAQERIWVTGSFHMGGYASGSWNVQKLSNRRTDLGEVEYVRADIHATALAAKDAELERRDMQLEASAKVALDLSAQLAEARKALDAVFDDTQARTKAGMTYGINGHPTLSPATLNIVAQARFAGRRALTGGQEDG